MDCLRYYISTEPEYVEPNPAKVEPSPAWKEFQKFKEEKKDGPEEEWAVMKLGPGVAR